MEPSSYDIHPFFSFELEVYGLYLDFDAISYLESKRKLLPNIFDVT